jgi:hypothetical protein
MSDLLLTPTGPTHHAIAGRWWDVPSLPIIRLPDGSETLRVEDMEPIYKAVAVALCEEPTALTPEALEFLCDLAGLRHIRLAEIAGVDRSAVTVWLRRNGPPLSRSLHLKRWFLLHLFPQFTAATTIPLSALALDADILRWISAAIRESIPLPRIRPTPAPLPAAA